MNNDLVTYGPTCLLFNRRPSREEGEHLMETLCLIQSRNPLYIGDALIALEALYGEDAAQMIPEGYSAKSLMNMRGVCRAVPPEMRRESLTFGHYDAVRGLPDAMMEQVIDRADAEDWTVSRTRDEVRFIRGRVPAEKANLEAIRTSVAAMDSPLGRVVECATEGRWDDVEVVTGRWATIREEVGKMKR